MIQHIINIPRVRNIIDSFPEDNKGVRLLRVLSKSMFFRKRIITNNRLVFEGVEDAICERRLDLANGSNEVLVKTIFTSVSPGTEKAYYLDSPNFYQPRPYIPGYSGSGYVQSKRKTSVPFKKDDLVAGIFKHSGMNIVTGDQIALVPPGADPLSASFVTLGVIALTGTRAAAVEGGENVAVLGQGILGQLVNQLVRVDGAARVTAVALGDSKKSMAEKSGVDEFLSISNCDRDLSALNYDIVIDITGSLKGFETALKMVKPGGRMVMLGSISDYAGKSNWARLLVEKEIEVRGAHVRNLEEEGLTYREEASRFLQLLAEKKVKLDHLITDVYKPKDAPEIYQRLAGGDRDMVGVVIDWQSA